MIDQIDFVNLLGNVFVFNSDLAPLHEFTTEVDVRSLDKERPQEHGIWPSHTWLGKRLYHLRGELLRDTSEQYNQMRLDMVTALLPRSSSRLEKKSGALKIWLTGQPSAVVADCTLDGYPELPMIAGSPARGSYMVNFKSFDPRLYSEIVNIQDINPNTEVTIINEGNVETWPTITLYGPSTNPAALVSRNWGQQLLTFNGTLATANDYVVINTRDKTAVDNLATNRYNNMSGDWWPVESGPQLVRHNATSPGVGTKMRVEWQNAWMI